MKFTLIFLLIVACFSFVTLAERDDGSEGLIQVIHEHLSELKSLSGRNVGTPLCHQYSCCNITESSDGCSIKSFPKDKTTLVLPGQDASSCIFGEATSGPFAFQVIPGAKENLLFYFQGGGACYDKFSTDQGMCTTTAEPWGPDGIFDRKNPRNAYRDWTIVHVLYCSGDLFVGDVVRSYTSKQGDVVNQTGLANTLSVVSWIQAQQARGNLAATFDQLTVMGCSAGALGAQAWSTYLLEVFKPRNAAVVSDSYAGVFPPKSVPILMGSYGVCGSVILTPRQDQLCRENKLTIEELNDRHLQASPHVAYTFLQSKIDDVQRSFYSAVALSLGQNPLLTALSFYQKTNGMFSTYNEHANFLTYLVDGTQHCFTPLPLYFSTNATSVEASTEFEGFSDKKEVLMNQWVNQLPVHASQSLSSICHGNDDSKSTTSCSPHVVPKTFSN